MVGSISRSTDDERQQRLAERLREAREYLGLSQQFVAEHTSIPRVAISAIENGKRKVEALELGLWPRFISIRPPIFWRDRWMSRQASGR